MRRLLSCVALAAGFVPGPVLAACFIQDQQVVCGNGVIINGASVSVMMGGRSLAPGTGDYVTPDGREVYHLPRGIFIGGSDRIERLPTSPPPVPAAK